ncbi:hypothetical protein IFR05_010808 [Cadophora sp. M221]|nr:hypothetical protein IFR05_010808 [Cadophora sp. M221]
MTDTVVSPIETGLPSFACFQKLPFELRLMVWGFALPGPRVIRLKPAANKSYDFVISSEIATSSIKVVTTISGVIHAVHESREVSLKHYSIAFEDHPKLLESLFSGPKMSKVRGQTLSKIHIQLMKFFQTLNQIIVPHKYPAGDFRRARNEIAGRHHFKHVRRSHGKALPGIDVEYKSPKEFMDMARAMLQVS